MPPHYKRILLKLSGEILAGPGGYGIDEDVIRGLAKRMRERGEVSKDELSGTRPVPRCHLAPRNLQVGRRGFNHGNAG